MPTLLTRRLSSTRGARSAAARRSGISRMCSRAPHRRALQYRPERGHRTRCDHRETLQDPEQRERLQGRDSGGRRLLRAFHGLHQRLQPPGRDSKMDQLRPTLVTGGHYRCQCDDRLRAHDRGVCLYRRRGGCYERRDQPFACYRKSGPSRRMGM